MSASGASSLKQSRDRDFWQSHRGVSLVWSNPDASDDVMIRNALLKPSFHLLLEIAVHFGFDELVSIWEELAHEIENSGWPEVRKRLERVRPTVERCLKRIREGMEAA